MDYGLYDIPKLDLLEVDHVSVGSTCILSKLPPGLHHLEMQHLMLELEKLQVERQSLA